MKKISKGVAVERSGSYASLTFVKKDKLSKVNAGTVSVEPRIGFFTRVIVDQKLLIPGGCGQRQMALILQ